MASSVEFLARRRNILMLVWFTTGIATAQMHFVFTANTGNNATVGIPTSAKPGIGGVPLSVGDEIGAFTPGGLCVGATVWRDSNAAITVWGDNDQTSTVDGIRTGEQIAYHIWQKSTGTEYTDVSAAYSQGDGKYGPDNVMVLDSLNAKTTTAVRRDGTSANAYFLFQNNPNPFNPSTIIGYDLPRQGFVALKIYDMLGREVKSMVNGVQTAGYHSVTFNAGGLSSGVYFYRLTTLSFSLVRKMMLIK
jgi:hypothetical protein